MTKEMVAKLGELADRCDNFRSATELPLPAHIHLEALREGMEQLRDDLRAIYVEVSGEDPWTL